MSIQSTVQLPPVEDLTLLGRDDHELHVRGRQLGFATSRRDIHSGHLPTFAGVSDDEIADVIQAFESRYDQLLERGASPESDTVVALRRYVDDLDNGDVNPATLTRYAAPGDRCSACRWFEVRIFDVETEYVGDCECDVEDDLLNETGHGCGRSPRGRYLVVTYGLTDVPGEVIKRRATWTNSPYTVVETLTQRRGAQAFLPATSARVLAEAAAVDADIASAYINRAVA